MINYSRFIKELGKCYQLHIETSGYTPENLHRRFFDNFYKAMRLRSVRRVRPTYLRLVNIEDHTQNKNRGGYRYISDIISPSLLLLAEICPIGPVDIDAPKLNAYQIMKCFEWPIEVHTMDHVTQRIVTRIHPLVVVTKLLTAYPKQIISFRFGLSHTLYLNPSIDDDHYFKADPMPFKYKRCTKFQAITFNYKDL